MCFTLFQCFNNRGLSLFYSTAAIKFLVKNFLTKIPKAIKPELLASIIEIADEEDYSELNEEVTIAKKAKDAIFLVKKYEDLFKR